MRIKTISKDVQSIADVKVSFSFFYAINNFKMILITTLRPNFCDRTLMHLFIFTFFYISRRKYWFGANFRFPVFDGFTRFGMS